MANQTNVSVIKALFDLKNQVEEADFNSLLSTLNVSLEEFQERVEGYENECEFLLGLQLCGLCNQITILDEKYSSIFGEDTCDAYITTKNGNKILVEIKSTKKDKFSITHNHFDKKLDYAKKQGIDLYFAIKINEIWLLLDSTTMQSVNLKVDITTCYSRSKLSKVFDCNYYLLSGIRFESIFRTDPSLEKNTIPVMDPDYGVLITDMFYKNDKLILKIKKRDKNLYFVSILSEALRDVSSRKVKDENKDKKIKIVEYTFGDNTCINSMDIALATIYHMINENGSKYNASDYMDHLKKAKETIMNLTPFIEEFANRIQLIPLTLV